MEVGAILMWALGVLLLAVNFFFVLAEFALVRLRGTRVDELIENGDRRALLVRRIQGDMDSYLSVVQVGITGATLGIGVIIEGGIAGPIERGLSAVLGESRAVAAAGHVLGFLIATFLVIVTSELLPKSLAIRYAEPCALATARPMIWTRNLFFPLLWLMTHAAQAIMRLLGLNRSMEEEPHSEDELRIILDRSQEHGLMSFRRLLFMENIFEIGELKVKDAMRPRAQVRCLDARAPWREQLDFIGKWPYSRLPLLDGDGDRPAGFVHVKDLLFQRYFHRAEAGEALDIRTLARPLITVQEGTALESVLAEMQRRRLQIAQVCNQAGTWTGILTLEDILEELVGTISDEFESEPPLTLADHLTERRVVLEPGGLRLADALRAAFARIPADELPLDRDAVVKAVLERERLAGTYLGKGIALPHARLAGMERAVLVLVRDRAGIPVEHSSERARLLFVLLTPAGQPRVHQRLQARIAQLIENSDYVEERLLDAATAAEVVDIIRPGEQASLD
ncbi:MAG: CNNM domain-containing protein [Planctomycetes bacterium]|nr:CNNM domain-containing protein [Planctomycetota bacterium]